MEKEYDKRDCMQDKSDCTARRQIIEEGRAPVSDVGGKGHNLLELSHDGFDVPPFFVLTTEAFTGFVSGNGRSMKDLVSMGNDGAARAILGMRFPESAGSGILDAYRRMFGGSKVSVRSSATVEDMAKESMAGRFETVLSVGEGELLEAVKKVYASLFSSGVELSGSTAMAVVVQKQILSQKAGVAFVDKDKVLVNAVLGQGCTLVSAKESGDIYVVTKEGTNASVCMQSKESMDGISETGIPAVVGAKSKLNSFEVAEIADTARKVMDAFGGPQDIEWCIGGGRLFVLQSRPITKPVEAPELKARGGALPVSKGTASGIAWFDTDIPDYDVVLIAHYIEIPDFDRLIENRHVKGLITEIGGMLSHESILAREKGIPYFTGIKRPEQLFKDSKNITMDTESKSITADGKEMLDGTSESYSWLNKGLDGLRSFRVGDRGLVARSVGDFVIAYCDVNGKGDAQDILRAMVGENDADRRFVLISERDIAPGVTYREAITAMNTDSGAKRNALAMAGAIDAFDAGKLRDAYAQSRSALSVLCRDAGKHYAQHEGEAGDGWISETFKRFVLTECNYKTIRIMPTYFEYALGSFMSGKEGKCVTDQELYRLRPEYEKRYPQIKETFDELENILNDVDTELTAPHADTGLTYIEMTRRILPQAEKALGKEGMMSLILRES